MPDSLCKNKEVFTINIYVILTRVTSYVAQRFCTVSNGTVIEFKMKHCRSRAKGYKFFMLNSAEHEIQITHK